MPISLSPPSLSPSFSLLRFVASSWRRSVGVIAGAPKRSRLDRSPTGRDPPPPPPPCRLRTTKTRAWPTSSSPRSSPRWEIRPSFVSVRSDWGYFLLKFEFLEQFDPISICFFVPQESVDAAAAVAEPEAKRQRSGGEGAPEEGGGDGRSSGRSAVSLRFDTKILSKIPPELFPNILKFLSSEVCFSFLVAVPYQWRCCALCVSVSLSFLQRERGVSGVDGEWCCRISWRARWRASRWITQRLMNPCGADCECLFEFLLHSIFVSSFLCRNHVDMQSFVFFFFRFSCVIPWVWGAYLIFPCFFILRLFWLFFLKF